MACTGTLLVQKNNLSCIGQSGKIKLRDERRKMGEKDFTCVRPGLHVCSKDGVKK